MADSAGGLLSLSLDTVSIILTHSEPAALASLSITCKQLSAQVAEAEEAWEGLARRGWEAWDPPLAEQYEQRGSFRAVLTARYLADRRLLAALERMAFPLERPAAVELIDSLGTWIMERLERECDAPGPLRLGHRHFANQVLHRVVCMQSCTRLRAFICRGDGGARNLEFGSLMLAQVHFPRSRFVEPVTRFVDQLGEELARRMLARGAKEESLDALQLLSQLLFDPPPPGDKASDPPPGVGSDAWRWDPACEALLQVPLRGYGLGIKGDTDNYYGPANSMLPLVLLLRRGNPITLAVLHAAVGRRAGIPVETWSVPTHFLNHCGKPHSPEERFVDVFSSGQLLTREQAVNFLTRTGVTLPARGCIPRDVYVRQCSNLIHHAYRQGGFTLFTKLRPLLEILLAAQPTASDYLTMHAQVVEELEDFEAVKADLAKLNALPEGRRHRRQAEARMQQGLVAPEIRVRLAQEQHAAACNKQLRRGRSRIKFYVGQVIRHRKFEYRGLIIGWDTECKAEPQWVQKMNVKALPGGTDQPFYHTLVDTRDRPHQTTYVAQDNLLLLEEEWAGAEPPPRKPPAVCEAAWGGGPAEEEDMAEDELEGGGVMQSARRPGSEEAGSAEGLDMSEGSEDGGETSSRAAIDFSIRHPSVGEYFLGILPGQTRYQMNAYLRQKYPDDVEGC